MTKIALRNLVRAASGLGLLALAACDATDPQFRDGLWHPIHVNRANLTLTAAYPADLVRGSGVVGSDGTLAAAAIDRLRTNKVKKLQDAGLSEIKVSSQSSGGE